MKVVDNNKNRRKKIYHPINGGHVMARASIHTTRIIVKANLFDLLRLE